MKKQCRWMRGLCLALAILMAACMSGMAEGQDGEIVAAVENVAQMDGTGPAACGEAPAFMLEGPAVPNGLALNASCVTVGVGKKFTLKPTDDSGAGCAYKVGNRKIASVSAAGVVKGKKIGTTTVTVTSGDESVTIPVRVRKDLVGFVGMKLSAAGKKLGMKRKVGEGVYYTKSGMQLGCFSDPDFYDGGSDYLSLSKDSGNKYAMGGCCLGMDEGEAVDVLQGHGWEIQRHDAGKYLAVVKAAKFKKKTGVRVISVRFDGEGKVESLYCDRFKSIDW